MRFCEPYSPPRGAKEFVTFWVRHSKVIRVMGYLKDGLFIGATLDHHGRRAFLAVFKGEIGKDCFLNYKDAHFVLIKQASDRVQLAQRDLDRLIKEHLGLAQRYHEIPSNQISEPSSPQENQAPDRTG